MRTIIVCLLATAIFASVNGLKLHRISNDDKNAVVEDSRAFYQRQDLGLVVDENGDIGMMAKRVQGPTGCGRAPFPPPPNTNMTSPLKQQYNVGEVITYRCAPAFMRLIDGSLQVTCQSDGKWSKLPVCQSYTFGCRRTKEAREYKGKVNVTRCGQPCQAWSADKPNKPSQDVRNYSTRPDFLPEYNNVYDAQNYCRNPDPGEKSGPWCYINLPSGARWGYCDVAFCEAFDIFDDYDRRPGGCGCQSEWYNAIKNYGNVKTMEGATLAACKYECDNSAQCQGIVYDEGQNKCWLKKCSCTDAEMYCTPDRHETYYRKKTPPCPGVEYFDRFNQRHCYYSLYNFNLNTSLVFDWPTSRKLCQDLFPLVSDMVALETDDEWDFLARNIAQLKVPLMYPRLWIGLFRPENISDAWQWVSTPTPYTNAYQPPLNYSRWAPGEPTNGYEEQCTQVVLTPQLSEQKTAVGRWADESCRQRAPVICEAKMPNFRTTKREDEAEMKREDSLSEGGHGKHRPHCKTDPCPVYEDAPEDE